jgi:hypothetical protein
MKRVIRAIRNPRPNVRRRLDMDGNDETIGTSLLNLL